MTRISPRRRHPIITKRMNPSSSFTVTLDSTQQQQQHSYNRCYQCVLLVLITCALMVFYIHRFELLFQHTLLLMDIKSRYDNSTTTTTTTITTGSTSKGKGMIVKQNTNQQQELIIRTELLDAIPLITAEYVWDQLIIEASYIKEQLQQQQQTPAVSNKIGVIMEVGVHSARQCIQAATAKLQVHCIEPSPKSFERIRTNIESTIPKDIQKFIHLHQYAAGSVTNETIPFVSAGSTGDHVGIYDMWNMKPGIPTDPKLKAKQGTTIHVPTIRLDDMITSNYLVDDETSVYLLKIDTQGFEPAVIEGLSSTLLHHKVQYVLMEFWPHGMDLMMNQETTKSSTTKPSCIGAKVLQQLIDYGYILYALPPSTHPKAPLDAKRYMKTQYYNNNHNNTSTTLNKMKNLKSFCEWFYSIEELYPSNEYKMGYWADILAVSTSSRSTNVKQSSSIQPYTDVGKVLV